MTRVKTHNNIYFVETRVLTEVYLERDETGQYSLLYEDGTPYHNNLLGFETVEGAIGYLEGATLEYFKEGQKTCHIIHR